jgi:HD-like signal output (HDOD) protein
MQAELDRRLSGLGLATQPGVAARIIALIAEPGAGLRTYAMVLRADAALSGRLLRLANSAYAAQVKPVTSVERACVVLGLERLKAVSLGFYLSRAAATDPNQVLSRRVWTQSVLRACLASELARVSCPGYAAEAFTIGLMLDAGAPLLHRLLGRPVERILASGEPPARQFEVESQVLPFTHVDVAAALLRRWSLPGLLAGPIESHHTVPGDSERPEPVDALHRIAFCAGAVSLTATPMPRISGDIESAAAGVMGLGADALAAVLRRTTEEYAAVREIFRDVADEIEDLAAMAERIHLQLLSVIDRSIADSLGEEGPAPAEFTVAGHRIEIEPEQPGRAVAYLRDGSGERVASHAFDLAGGAGPVLGALGIDRVSDDESIALEQHLRSMAA